MKELRRGAEMTLKEYLSQALMQRWKVHKSE